MNKKQQASELTRKRIVESARHVFIQKGYAATSIEDLATATGSSKGNIYYHFKSKEGLMLFLLQEWEREWEEQWSEIEPLYSTFTDKMYGIADYLVQNGFNHPLTKVANEFYSNKWVKDDIQEQISQIMLARVKFNEILLQEGVNQGKFDLGPDEVNILAIIFEGLLTGLGEMTQNANLDQALKIYKKSIDIFLYGIAKRS
ncbi:TetR family transcriptional regulator [Paenibacillus macquariensis subsp. macquariensis]|nr:TetR family transcriptional regulator [Paenibacillus macquariensis subsp. macquariensis]